MAGFTIKRNDRRPHWRVALSVNEIPLGVGTASAIKFTMKSGSTIKVNKANMDIIDAGSGLVEYAWQDGDTDTSGVYNAEVEIDWGGTPAELQTFPNEGYFTITIVDDLA